MACLSALKGLIKKNKTLKNLIVKIINYSNGMSPSKQWGRIFDLTQKN